MNTSWLKAIVDDLTAPQLELLNTDNLAKLESERKIVEDLQRVLEDRSIELDSLKKKANRELGVHNGIQSPFKSNAAPQSPSKHDLEEITGLKCGFLILTVPSILTLLSGISFKISRRKI